MTIAVSQTVCCPSCGADDVKAGSRFCETCGKPMPMPASAVKSGCACGGEFNAQGDCSNCGARRAAARDQLDRIVMGAGFAGITDVGRHHKRNDDAFVLAGSGQGGAGCRLVICDGVSNSQVPDIASVAASKAALEVMQTSADNAQATARAAIVAAHEMVCSVPFDRQGDVDPPASTIVTVNVAEGTENRLEVVVGWLGDTRLYWLAPNGSGQLLTRDHSWCNQVVDEGRMTMEQAQADRMAHAITKCLGTSDFETSTPCPEPSVVSFQMPRQGWLLACTDGLWNYADTPTALILAANGRLWTQPAEAICKQLVDYALSQGGQDNVTCVLVRLG